MEASITQEAVVEAQRVTRDLGYCRECQCWCLTDVNGDCKAVKINPNTGEERTCGEITESRYLFTEMLMAYRSLKGDIDAAVQQGERIAQEESLRHAAKNAGLINDDGPIEISITSDLVVDHPHEVWRGIITSDISLQEVLCDGTNAEVHIKYGEKNIGKLVFGGGETTRVRENNDDNHPSQVAFDSDLFFYVESLFHMGRTQRA